MAEGEVLKTFQCQFESDHGYNTSTSSMNYFLTFINGGGWLLILIALYFLITHIVLPIYVAWRDTNGNGVIDDNE